MSGQTTVPFVKVGVPWEQRWLCPAIGAYFVIIDLRCAHLRYVHGYDNVEPAQQVSVDGPRLETRFDFKRTRTVARAVNLTFDVSASTRVVRLGYSFVEMRERSIGMDLRLWVLATPIDGTLIDLSLVSQAREIHKPGRMNAGMGFLPVRLRGPIMNKIMAFQQRQDVLQDVVIWSRKQYRSRPRLCRFDGKIMPFRYNCSQFYLDPEDCDSSTS